MLHWFGLFCIEDDFVAEQEIRFAGPLGSELDLREQEMKEIERNIY